jgi:hypothetical protein
VLDFIGNATSTDEFLRKSTYELTCDHHGARMSVTPRTVSAIRVWMGEAVLTSAWFPLLRLGCVEVSSVFNLSVSLVCQKS